MNHNPEVWQKKKLKRQCSLCSKKGGKNWCSEFFTFDSAFCYLKGHDCGYRKEK